MSSRMPSDVASSGVKQQRQPPRTEMSSASRGSGAVHDALDSIDLRLHLHDLVPWPRRLCPAEAGRHSLGPGGCAVIIGAVLCKEKLGAGKSAKRPRRRRFGYGERTHTTISESFGEDGSEDCCDENIQRLRLRSCARTAECPRARSQKTVAKQGRHLEGGSN